MEEPIFILQVNDNKQYFKPKSEPVDDPDELAHAIEEAEMESENILQHDNNCLENYTSHDSLNENFDLMNGNVIMNCENVMDQNDLVLDQTEEEVVTCLTDNEQVDLANSEDSNIIIQHMDIRQPLSTLRNLLHQRLNIDLNDYEFWLQDAQMLESHKNLVDQCVQGEGLVQINVQLISTATENKINIVDVLKPAEEYFEYSENSSESPTNEHTVTADPQKNVVRWAIDPVFKKEQERLKFPTDPREWSNVHVRHWLQWAVRQFNLIGLTLSEWNMNGRELCSMTLSNFQSKVPSDPGDFFWTHLELLRKCNIVATIQKQEQQQQQQQNQHHQHQQQNQQQQQHQQNQHQQQNQQLQNQNHQQQNQDQHHQQQHQHVHQHHLQYHQQIPGKSTDVVSQPKAFKGKSKSTIPNSNLVMEMPVLSNAVSQGNRIGNNGQIQLWQFLLELLTDKEHRNIIQWQGSEGEFKLINHEMVAQLWGERKNKPTMNYEKLSRALRYYYDGDMIAKVHGKRFVYKFVCDLKQILGYSASELNRLVEESARKSQPEEGW